MQAHLPFEPTRYQTLQRGGRRNDARRELLERRRDMTERLKAEREAGLFQ